MTEIATERLLLRPFREADFPAYAAMVADREVMRFMGGPRDPETAWRELAGILGHWVLRGYGLWAVEERAGGALVGRIGLINPQGWPGLEVGWLLARSQWGRGYATEGARAALGHAFDVVGADHVISLINPANTASIRVAERLGETFERVIQMFGGDTLVYGIDRPD